MPTYNALALYEIIFDPEEYSFTVEKALIDPIIGLPGTVSVSWTTASSGPTLETGERAVLMFGDPPTILDVEVVGLVDSGVGNFWPMLKVVDEERYLFAPSIDGFGIGGTVEVWDEGEVLCFLAGTRIATPAGEVAVEDLNVGDLVLTADGRSLPVRFIGRQTIVRRFSRSEENLPIQISAGALGHNLPVRDLFVSRAHAIGFGDVLVQAGALVNGTTIRRATELPNTFTYYHVEVAEHVLLLAEGVAAESFIDSAETVAFHNVADRPDYPPIAEIDMPRARSHRQVPRQIRALIAERTAALARQDAAAA